MSRPDPDRDEVLRPPFNAIAYRALRQYWSALAVVVLAIVIRSVSWLNCDVSWFITLGERLLAGARPYVDFSDPNPPASILIYIPPILLGRAIGVSPEFAVTISVFVATLSCLWLVGRILNGSKLAPRRDRPILVAVICTLLLILPGDAFAQREHIAVLAILPMLAAYSQRALGTGPSGIWTGLAGVGAGIAVAIKPYFALALIVPLFYVVGCWRMQKNDVRGIVLWPEHLMSALIVIAYGIVVHLFFPDYVNRALPVALAVYIPSIYTMLHMITNSSVLLLAMIAIVGLGLGVENPRIRTAPIVIAGLAALGFAFALIVQGKGWPYHGYPAVALAMIALVLLLGRRLAEYRDSTTSKSSQLRDVVFGVVLSLCIYALASFCLLNEPGKYALVNEVARVAPVHPKIITLAGGPELAFPLTRKLQGTAVGRAPFQWISYFAEKRLASEQLPAAVRTKIEECARLDRDELTHSIHDRHPDVILIEGESERAWAFSYPQIAAALQMYHSLETINGVEIWLPRTQTVAP